MLPLPRRFQFESAEGRRRGGMVQWQLPPGNLTIFVQVNRAVQPGGRCNRGDKMTTEYEYGFADGRAAQARIARCPDRTTCQNEAMIEELREQLAAVTAERDELKAWRDSVPVREFSILVTCLQILIDASGKQRETDPVLGKALDWIEARERESAVTEVTP